MIALLLAGSAHAWTRTVNVCVDYDVAFWDAIDTATKDAPDGGLGDFWDVNDVDRAAIGMAYTITTNVETVTGNLDTAGCVTRALNFTGGTNQSLTFKVTSTTRRRGIDLEYRFNQDPDIVIPDDAGDLANYSWQDAVPLTKTWGLFTTSSSTSFDLPIAAIDGWQFLAVGTWLIRIQSLGVRGQLFSPG